MPTGPALGDVLADIMREHSIAAIEIARELGVSPALVARWTRNEALPSRDDLMLLVERLGPRDAERLQRAGACVLAPQPAAPEAASRRLCDAEREALLGLPAEFRLAFAQAMRRSGQTDQSSS